METGRQSRGGAARIATQEVTGLISGTSVLTLDGDLPVDHLTSGDRVITRDSGMAVLREVRVSEVEIAPIAVRAGSLGHSRPDRDTEVAPGTPLHIRDWRAKALYGTATANIPARRLTDGEFVAERPRRRVRVHDLIFDRLHIVYADGLEVAAGTA